MEEYAKMNAAEMQQHASYVGSMLGQSRSNGTLNQPDTLSRRMSRLYSNMQMIRELSGRSADRLVGYAPEKESIAGSLNGPETEEPSVSELLGKLERELSSVQRNVERIMSAL